MRSIISRVLFLCSILFFSFGSASQAFGQWVQIGALPNQAIHGFGTIGETLFVGTEGGIFLTSDDGASWTPSNNGFAGGIVFAFITVGSNILVGADSGVFLSTDLGQTWREKSIGLTDRAITAFAQNAVGIFAGSSGGVLLSTDNGNNWHEVSTGLPNRRTLSMAAFGQNIFAGGTGGVDISTDNGSNWAPVNTGLANELIFAMTANGQNIFAGTNAGVSSSTNNGSLWITDTSGMSYTTVDAFAAQGSNIFVGSFNPVGSVFLSTNAGTNWTAENDGLPNTIRPIYAIAVSGSNLFIGTNGDGVWRRPLSDFGISFVAQNAPTTLSISNYPNPFSQSTMINFTSPESGIAEVTIVNSLGQQVARLFDGELDAGPQSFEWDASNAAAGTYFSIIRTSDGVQRAPMVLAR